jgi:hypothetical protein
MPSWRRTMEANLPKVRWPSTAAKLQLNFLRSHWMTFH